MLPHLLFMLIARPNPPQVPQRPAFLPPEPMMPNRIAGNWVFSVHELSSFDLFYYLPTGQTVLKLPPKKIPTFDTLQGDRKIVFLNIFEKYHSLNQQLLALMPIQTPEWAISRIK